MRSLGAASCARRGAQEAPLATKIHQIPKSRWGVAKSRKPLMGGRLVLVRFFARLFFLPEHAHRNWRSLENACRRLLQNMHHVFRCILLLQLLLTNNPNKYRCHYRYKMHTNKIRAGDCLSVLGSHAKKVANAHPSTVGTTQTKGTPLSFHQVNEQGAWESGAHAVSGGEKVVQSEGKQC